MKTYDSQFNGNEWFIIAGLLVGAGLLIVLPRRFSRKVSILFFTTGVFNGFFFDHSLSVQPASMYDVNDSSNYQFMDFLSYLTFGPYSYLFFYFLHALKLSAGLMPVYILIWSFFSLGLEGYSDLVGIYHYQNGYTIFYSFAIYLLVHSCWYLFYNYIIKKELNECP